MRKLILSQIVLLIFWPALSWGEDLFVQSHTAPMFEKPSLGSEKIMVLNQGTKVSGLKKKGMWRQVIVRDKTGWTCTLMLSNAPPMEPLNISDEEMDQMSSSARKRPSAYASTAAARGLLNSRKRLGSKTAYDYNALKKMESYAPSEEETLKFIQEKEE